ncbi:sensor histidine kinase [Claveliimonas bilis]|uniref:ATP-binding protein n=1 Tax=Claveliimonas bilis TaxID=3028070 RepID=UPI001E5E2BA9|nr:ATP-binding protein [Claveliimonas bilis]BCZ26425.1 sensor histidine kinase [Claveliimonas bilis]
MREKAGKILLYTLAVVFAAQISMTVFIVDFQISIGVILLAAFFFLVDGFPVLTVTLLSSGGVFAARIIIYWLQNGDIAGRMNAFMPEIVFYISYGLLLYLYGLVLKTPILKSNLYIFPLVIIDYGANFLELSVRLGENVFDFETQSGIFVVACLRVVISWGIVVLFRQYHLILLKKDHEDRYRRLLIMISKLNEEVIWMRKNSALIEETMATSYHLFEKLKEDDRRKDLSESALSIAKDVHEIKKEYFLIMRGLTEALDKEMKNDKLPFADLLAILKNAALRTAGEYEKKLELEIETQDDFYTDKHYFLMSIFRNLFLNAIEAEKGNYVKIIFSEKKENDFYIFRITDQGPGINKEDIEYVFDAGFSTKINYETGIVSRGLGLNLVQDLVEKQFSGTISVVSVPGNTTFTISIPCEEMTV